MHTHSLVHLDFLFHDRFHNGRKTHPTKPHRGSQRFRLTISIIKRVMPKKHNYALFGKSPEAPRQFARLPFRESPLSSVSRRCNIFTLLGDGARNAKRRKRRRRATCRSSGRTFDNELYFPRRCARSTWESRSVPEIDREVAGLALASFPAKTSIHFRRLSRVYRW